MFKCPVTVGSFDEFSQSIDISAPVNLKHIPPFPRQPVAHGFYYHIRLEMGNKIVEDSIQGAYADVGLSDVKPAGFRPRTRACWTKFLAGYLLTHLNQVPNIDAWMFENFIVRFNNLNINTYGKHMPKYVFKPPQPIGVYSTFIDKDLGVLKRNGNLTRFFSGMWMGNQGYLIATGLTTGKVQLYIFSQSELPHALVKSLRGSESAYDLERLLKILETPYHSVEDVGHVLDLQDDKSYLEMIEQISPLYTPVF